MTLNACLPTATAAPAAATSVATGAAVPSPARLALVARLTRHCVLLLDAHGRVSWVNEAFERETGFAAADIVGRVPREVLRTGATRSEAAAAMDRALATGSSLQVRMTRRRKAAGAPHVVDIDLQPFHDAQGALEGFVLVETDVTPLVEEREAARALLQALPVGVLVRDARGEIVDANPAASEIIGRPRESLLGRGFDTERRTVSLPDGTTPGVSALPAEQTLATGLAQHAVPLQLKRADGQTRSVRISTAPLRDTGGRISGVISCLADETELITQRAMFAVAQDAARILSWRWDVQADRVEFEYRRAAALGFAPPGEDVPPQAVIAVPLWTTVHRADREAIVRAIESHQRTPDVPYRAEFRLPDAQGRWRWVLACGSATQVDAQGCALRMDGVMLDIHDRKMNEAALERAASIDPVTDLPNRAVLLERLERALHTARRQGHRGALLFIDLDRFKRINDMLGHSAGDALLRSLGQRLAGLLRAEDTLARMGGDEWMVLLPHIGRDDATAHDAAWWVANKLLGALIEPFALAEGECRVGASIGLTLFPKTDDEGTDDLVRQADAAMYEAKAAGRGGVRAFEPRMLESAVARFRTERALQQALEHEQFSLALQPKWRADGALHGAEVLLRWVHPERGNIPPSEFIPVAEDSGLIAPVGRWVLRQACKLTAACRQAKRPLSLAVNVSPRQFLEPSFVAELDQLLHATGARADDLVLEITEGLLIDDIDGATRRMRELSERGFSLSIDDFGTGYSSLMYLKRLPIDELKIDRGFVRDITTDPDDAAIVQAILGIAQRFAIATVAEGVETEAQAAFLRAHGCQLLQGYLLGKPVPVAEFFQRWG
jgi:diguanylate cyclase (GGDEF)-like protein/PAS domain S-box-containing protein